MKILLLEDDQMISSGLIYAIENEGYEVTHCETVQAAIHAIQCASFHLAVVDMQLPDGIGFEVQEVLKSTNTPIIFLTVVDDENQIVKAFEEGAVDYVVKPFRVRELLARIKRILAQYTNSHQDFITIGQIKIDLSSGKIYVGTKQIILTALEYRLLLIFAQNQTRLLTRNQILEKLWDMDGNFVEDNTLTVYVKRLREKLGNAVHIETVRGMGYRVDS